MYFIGVNARKMREIKVAAAVIFHGRNLRHREGMESLQDTGNFQEEN